KFSSDHSECAFTELDDCGLSGLVGLTFAPLHLAAVAPPPPPPIAPPPPPPPAPTPAPVAPPEPPPVTPPQAPTEPRPDALHLRRRPHAEPPRGHQVAVAVNTRTTNAKGGRKAALFVGSWQLAVDREVLSTVNGQLPAT